MPLQFTTKIIGICGVIFTLLLLSATTVYALDIRGGDRIEIGEGEVIEDDLVIGAETIVINGTVRGDVIFGATTLILNGTIEGDLMGGGSEVQINGTVTDDVRLGAAAVRVGPGATIGDDMMMGGYSLETGSDSTIGGQLYFGGGQALLTGAVAQDLFAGTGALELRGTVGGNVLAEVGPAGDAPPFNPMQFQPNAPQVPTVPLGLTIADSAAIGGRLEYSSSDAFTIPDEIASEVVFNQQASAEDAASSGPLNPARLGLGSLGRLIAYLLVALLLVWLLAPLLRRSEQMLRRHFGPSFGWGMLATFGIPIALLLFIALIIFFAVIFGQLSLGILSGIIGGVGVVTFLGVVATYILLFNFISKIIVGYWLGRLLFRDMENMVLPLLVGLLIVALLVSAPFVGWLFSFLIGILGIGALIVARAGAGAGQRSAYEI